MNKIVKFLNPFTMKHMVKLNPYYITLPKNNMAPESILKII